MGKHVSEKRNNAAKRAFHTRKTDVSAVSGPGRLLLRKHIRDMRRAVKEGVYAGLSDIAFHRGRVVFRRSWGHADLEHGTRFDTNTLCRVYCLGKSYTNFVTMMLVEEGLLKLQDPVGKYIPSMLRPMLQGEGSECPPRPAKKVMRVWHLVTHSAGYTYPSDFNYPPNEKQLRYCDLVKGVEQGRIRSLAAWVDELAKVPLIFEPGTRYEYSYCSDVLGRVLEVASGQDLATLFEEKLFRPLGMVDTSFGVPESKFDRLGAVYGSAEVWGNIYGKGTSQFPAPVVSKPGEWLVRLDGNEPKESAWAERAVKIYSGGGFVGVNRGGLVSTAEDTLAYCRMLLNGGRTPDGRRLIKPSTLKFMTKNLLVGKWKPDNDNSRWCILGDMVKYNGVLYFQQGGAGGTYWILDKKNDLAVIVFMQQVDGEQWNVLGYDEHTADLEKCMIRCCAAAGA